MSALQIREVDPRDEAALRSWWEVGRDASAERPLEAWPVWEVSRALLPVPRTDGRQVLLEAVRTAARSGRRGCGSSGTTTPTWSRPASG